MDFWIELSRQLRRIGFTSALTKQLRRRLERVDPEELIAMSASRLAGMVSDTGANFTTGQAEQFRLLIKSVFDLLEAETQVNPTPQSSHVRFTFRFRDANSPGKPRVPNLLVHIRRQGSGNPQDADLFKGRTNRRGEVSFQVAAADASTNVRLSVTVLDNETLFADTVRLRKNAPLVTTELKLGDYRAKLAVPLKTWQQTLKKEISSRLADLFKQEKISTLRDIRLNAEKLRSIQDLSPEERAELEELLAHANLQLLSRHLQFNQLLIDAKFTNVFAIARVSRASFLKAIGINERIGLRIYEIAQRQTETVKNVAIVTQLAQVNGQMYGQTQAQTNRPCACDCQSAVSPLAYLADLLDLVLREVTYDNNVLELSQLESLFYQPFGSLPADCSASEEIVRQVRICIEVLRRKALVKIKPDEFNKNTSIAQHPARAYDALLAGLGTSTRELRLLLGAPDEDRKAKAQTLGIDVGQLNSLLLRGDQLSERSLEVIFGFQDTTRDPLSFGVKFDDPSGAITQWQLKGVEWRGNTSGDGRVFGSLIRKDESLLLGLFTDSARTRLVAYAEQTPDSEGGPVTLTLGPKGESGLYGNIVVAEAATNSNFELCVIPQLLIWQWSNLFGLWVQEDHPQLFSPSTFPIVDPDYLTEANFCRPLTNQVNELKNPAFGLWKDRGSDLGNLRQLINVNDTTGQKRTFAEMFEQVWNQEQMPAWDEIETDLNSGDEAKVNARILELSNGKLSAATFAFLNQLRQRALAAAGAPTPTIIDPEIAAREDAEREQAIDILLNVKKLRDLYEGWREDELAPDKSIQLTPKFFCIPSVELPAKNPLRFSPEQMAQWQSELERNSQPPIVDPDVLNAAQNIAPIDGSADLFRQKRNTQLEEISGALEQSLGNNQITVAWLDARLGAGDITDPDETIIVHGLGLDAIDDLQTAFNERRLQIQPQQYGLTRRELEALLTMRRLLIADFNLIDEQDRKNALHILVQAEKRRYLFPTWRNEETFKLLTLSPEFFRNPDHPLLELVSEDTREPEFIEWRGDARRLREWRSRLAARFRQQASVHESLRTVVDQAEEATLPALRDALIDVVYYNGSGSNREQNKKLGTNTLLINCSESACRKTTRVAQAIETLQLLVWGVLNYQIENISFRIPDRDHSEFEANWYWLKSYATWRAAMFVFLYPENILMPRLRPETDQTLLFKAIIRILDGTATSSSAPGSTENSDQTDLSDDERTIQSLVDKAFGYLRGVPPRSNDGVRVLISREMRIDAGDMGNDYITLVPKVEDKFYLPLHFALTLQQDGDYESALEWFRKIYDFRTNDLDYSVALLLSEQSVATAPVYNGELWLNDKLNPHLLAATRPDVMLRFVQISIVRCHLEYAEAEFTIDTPESLARARELYYTAQNILDGDELRQDLTDCEGEIEKLILEVGEIDEEMSQVVVDTLVETPEEPEQLTEEMIEILRDLGRGLVSGGPIPSADDIRNLVREHLINPTVVSVGDRIRAIDLNEHQTLSAVLAKPYIFDQVQQIGSGTDERLVPQRAARMARAITSPAHDFTDTEDQETVMVRVKMPDVVFEFCIPPNAILIGLRLRTNTGLFKLNNCMNVAGMRREVPVYAAATDPRTGMPGVGVSGTISLPTANRLQGTQYRYRVLAERAKQLIGIAQQLEATYLSFLEKFDLETYNILRARHDLNLAGANVELQGLRVTEAQDGEDLALEQWNRSNAAVTYYEGLIAGELLPSEKAALLYSNIAVLVNAGVALTKGVVIIGPALTAGGGAGAIAGAVASALTDPIVHSAIVGALSSASSAASMEASFARRAEEWEFQKELAKADIHIAEVQQTLAADRVSIVTQEETIANIGASNAEDVLNFLNNKFTNADLYSWMSGIVGGVYRYFLEQSTVLAKLAQAQLAFERQETGLNFILSDYSTVTSGSGFLDTNQQAGVDRKGMTGSARLLHDLYRLDQHAFTTDRRKLQMSKTLSLALQDPIAFQQFRETGVLPFTTSLDLFDRDLPGHYLRLIKRVRTSVIALIPPTLGIKATLASTGISQVVVSTESGGNFETRSIVREPELVALTSPSNDSGVFELQEQSEMLLPFEGIGVANSWEFRMPKAANAFDFSTIADVLITMEYTAFNSSTYRDLVTERLDRTVIADRPFSFRHQFADAWYDLHHPELLAEDDQQMRVSFTTRREDFPPNVSELKIEHLSLFIAYKAGSTGRVTNLSLRFTSQGQTGAADYSASPNANGILSTRLGNAASWRPLMTQLPIGEWRLTLPLTEPETLNLFQEDQIEDILFVITYNGLTPEWPR